MISKKIGPLKSLQHFSISFEKTQPIDQSVHSPQSHTICAMVPHALHGEEVPKLDLPSNTKTSCAMYFHHSFICISILPNSISWSSFTSTPISISALVSAYPILPLSRGPCLCTSLCFYLYLRLKICVGASPSLHFLYAFLRLCFVYLYS